VLLLTVRLLTKQFLRLHTLCGLHLFPQSFDPLLRDSLTTQKWGQSIDKKKFNSNQLGEGALLHAGTVGGWRTRKNLIACPIGNCFASPPSLAFKREIFGFRHTDSNSSGSGGASRPQLGDP